LPCDAPRATSKLKNRAARRNGLSNMRAFTALWQESVKIDRASIASDAHSNRLDGLTAPRKSRPSSDIPELNVILGRWLRPMGSADSIGGG